MAAKIRWEQRINKAESEQQWGFTEDDKRKAVSYVTCACGEQDQRIQRRPGTYEPLDTILSGLGMEFYWAVRDNDTNKAKVVLALIEQRAKKVLAEQGVV